MSYIKVDRLMCFVPKQRGPITSLSMSWSLYVLSWHYFTGVFLTFSGHKRLPTVGCSWLLGRSGNSGINFLGDNRPSHDDNEIP